MSESGPPQNRLVLVAHLNLETRITIGKWAKSLAWPDAVQLKDYMRYHCTLLYCEKVDNVDSHRDWLFSYARQRFKASAAGLARFTNPGYLAADPIVLQLDSPELVAVAAKLRQEAIARGLTPSHLNADFRPHITVAITNAVPIHSPLRLSFTTRNNSLIP